MLQAWPPPEEVEALRSGEDVPTRELLRTRSCDDGTFELLVTTGVIASLQEFASQAGIVMVEVTGFTDQGAATEFLHADFDFDRHAVRGVYRDEDAREPLSGTLVIVAPG